MKKILWLAALSVAFVSCLNIGNKSEGNRLEGQVADEVLADKSGDLSKQKGNIADKDSSKIELYTVAAPDKYTCWPRIGKVGVGWSMHM